MYWSTPLLQARILEHGLDHQFHADQVAGVDGGNDPGQHGVALRPGQGAPGHGLVQ
jgi:hypothetical protein